MEYIKILFTVAVAATGWLITHYYTSKRDIENSRRRSRIESLSIAYKAFVRAGIDEDGLISEDRDGNIVDKATPVEDAIALVHLYGNKEQSVLASKCAKQFQDTGSGGFTEIVDSLRKDIRDMLGEDDLDQRPLYLSVSRKTNK